MIEFDTELFLDEGLFKLFNKRQWNKSFKMALQYAIKKWHEDILKTHFTSSAYRKYASVYGGSNGKRLAPMVKTGQLRRSVLSNIKISGTAKNAKGRVNFGLPRPMTEEDELRIAFSTMKRLNTSLKVALKKVRMSRGNYASNRKKFEAQIQAVNETDIKMMKKWVIEFLLEEFKTKGRKRKVKKITSKGVI